MKHAKNLLLGSVVLLTVSKLAIANEQPSIIIMIADDQGWGDLSRHGNKNLSTPNLDSFAKQGASFDRFHVQPVCSPTRAEMLTACYAPRTNVVGVTAGGERMNPKFPTLADACRAAGYATAAFGKWHNGTQAPYHPLCRGFDSFYGYTSGHWANYFSPMLDRNGEITRGKGFLTDDITDEAIQFVKQNHERPFFALIAFNTPHSPMQVPDRWYQAHANQELASRGTLAEREKIDHTRAALAMVENIDWNVGRMLETLDELKIDDNTIVVYLSDNGPNGHRFNDGLRGIKGSTDDGGVRSPLFVRWPAKIDAGRVVAQLSGAIDLAPTLAELADFPLIAGPKIDGMSVAPQLRGEAQSSIKRTLFSHWGGRVAVREGRLMLDHEGRLYDLYSDPNQTIDVTSKHPDDVKRLAQKVANWRRDVLQANATGKRPFTVGHPSLPATHLPARDATTRGSIERSNHHFNSTYFTNWTSTDDAVVWSVDVLTPGRYSAVAYYTCSEAGSRVELRLGEAACEAVVAPAYDPPLVAAKHDRFTRQEGDMKAFRPLDLGELTLPAGQGELTLKALNIAGNNVMDIRLVELRQIDTQ